jgi:prefoldin subunit 5
MARKIKTDEEKLAEVDASITDCHERIKPIHRRLDRLIKRRDKLRDAIDKAQLSQMGDEIDWGWLLSVHPESQIKYKKRDEAIYELGQGHMMTSGYFHETNQSFITIMLDYKGETASLAKAIRVLHSHLKPLKDGYIHMNVLDHTCGEHESVNLLFLPDGSEFKIKGRWSDKATFHFLEEALDYIAIHFPYNNAPETDDDW